MNTSSSITLSLSGMTCNHCVAAVQAALKAVPGIASSQVRVGSATIVANSNADANVVRAAAVEAIRGAGYDVDASNAARRV